MSVGVRIKQTRTCGLCKKDGVEFYATMSQTNDQFLECPDCGHMVALSNHVINYYRYYTDNFIIYYRCQGEFKDKYQVFFRLPQKSMDFIILSNLDVSDLSILNERLKNLVVFS